jgi:hypothetical protein
VFVSLAANNRQAQYSQSCSGEPHDFLDLAGIDQDVCFVFVYQT